MLSLFFLLFLLAAHAYANTSVINREGLELAEQNIPATFLLVTKDASGQTVTAQVRAADFVLQLTAKDKGDGTYAFVFTPVKSGEHVIEVKLGSNVVGSTRVDVLPPTVSEASTVEGTGIAPSTHGTRVGFIITPRNRIGVVLHNVTCRFGARIYGKIDVSRRVELLPTADGKFQGTYEYKNGMKMLGISIAGKSLLDAPFNLISEPTSGLKTNPYPPKCTATGPGITGGSTTGSSKYMTFSSIDISGALITGELNRWTVVVKNPNDTPLVNMSTDDDSIWCNYDGHYDGSYTPQTTGMHTVTVSVKVSTTMQQIGYSPFHPIFS